MGKGAMEGILLERHEGLFVDLSSSWTGRKMSIYNLSEIPFDGNCLNFKWDLRRWAKLANEYFFGMLVVMPVPIPPDGLASGSADNSA